MTGKPMTTKMFITKANSKHNFRYSYATTNYLGSKQKVTITCPIHGDFEQRAGNHLEGYGCSKCGQLASASSVAIKGCTLNTEEFIERAIAIHGDTYSYVPSHYTGSKRKLIITCSIHGYFLQYANDHLSGSGCQKCANVNRSGCPSYTKEEFIYKANLTHSNKYSYTLTSYTSSRIKVSITCNLHGPFLQRPSHHLEGAGCPKCTKYGFDKTKPAILYYLSINNGEAYKIGITNRTVEERYSNAELSKIEILFSISYNIGLSAKLAERRIITKYKEYKYSGSLLLKSGHTEMFISDIFNGLYPT